MDTQFELKWIPSEELESILPLVFLLNSDKISMEVLKSRLVEMIPMGFKCFGVYDAEKLIGVCGVWVLNKLYAGKHVEPDNVIVSPDYQGHRIGNLMMQFLFDYAKEIGCVGAEVNCYAKNPRGKKFWEDNGYEPLGHHMIKKFD